MSLREMVGVEIKKKNLRSIGGIAGALVAVAGGLGAAVGIYTLPDVNQFMVGGHAAYASVEQRAVAASTLQPGPFGGTILRISVTRGVRDTSGFTVEGSKGGGVNPSQQGSQSVGVLLEAEIHTCQEFGCEPGQQWRGNAALDSFEFDPLMNTASFAAEVGGCRFEVSWSGAGETVPFEGHRLGSSSDVDAEDWDARFFGNAGVFGEASRTARAHIQLSPAEEGPSCADYVRDGAPGYLTQGAALGEVIVESHID